MQLEKGQSVFIAAHNREATKLSEENEMLQNTGVNEEIETLMNNYPWSKGKIVEFPGKDPGMHMKAESEIEVSRYDETLTYATVFRHGARLLCKIGSPNSHISVESTNNAHMWTTRLNETIDTSHIQTIHIETEVELI